MAGKDYNENDKDQNLGGIDGDDTEDTGEDSVAVEPEEFEDYGRYGSDFEYDDETGESDEVMPEDNEEEDEDEPVGEDRTKQEE